jgi:hypothetical protein
MVTAERAVLACFHQHTLLLQLLKSTSAGDKLVVAVQLLPRLLLLLARHTGHVMGCPWPHQCSCTVQGKITAYRYLR